MTQVERRNPNLVELRHPVGPCPNADGLWYVDLLARSPMTRQGLECPICAVLYTPEPRPRPAIDPDD
jgi:hypothetical protein